ncbi:MAG: hypothetical protein ABSG30_15195 [Steroidobacteraceae bacterium]|jgi:hypothetical protein
MAVAYLLLPLAIFLASWFEIWAALPLLICLVYSMKGLIGPVQLDRAVDAQPAPARMHLVVAVLIACAWTACGGTGHLVFANADWHVRDAVLHDLVTGPWPVAYLTPDGATRLLRAPIGFYLPAALVGKWAGLMAAHAAMAAWTAAGATLFLLQVLSSIPSRLGGALVAAAVIVLFSGLDVVGILLHAPAGATAHWDFTWHLEWWAERYQYSSMTTQLFWVPNHALCGWVVMGLMMRSARGALEPMLPILIVAVALCSPLTALGVVPFALLRVGEAMRRSLALAHPRVWVPASIVGLVVAAYLTLDSSRIPRSWTVGSGSSALSDLARQSEFFVLEAGLVGGVILTLRRSRTVVLALVVLALLPLVSFGEANDFVMRASIPSLAALAMEAARALAAPAATAALNAKKILLGALLAIGAVTPFQEFARATVLPRWPINARATLVDAACGRYPPHYAARLDGQPIVRLLRPPHPLFSDPPDTSACENPAIEIERERDIR